MITISRAGSLLRHHSLALILGTGIAMSVGTVPARADGPPPQLPDLGPHIVIGWNDLGMHCANQRFADLAVLPPYNTFWSVIIQRGDATHLPQVLGPGYSVNYSIQDNTYSVGKTDFWSYVYALFGVHLPDDIGLTGKGLAGSMDLSASQTYFRVEGVPLTPFTDFDLTHEQPYQLGNLEARDSQGALIAATQIVVPVSNEMTCNACHHPQGGETVDQAILRLHDSEEGTHLMSARPVLCANCHASNALGMPGLPDVPSLSLAMHRQHAEETDNCYLCHPGPTTRCLRDVMSQQYGLTCQSCHGHMIDVFTSIENGRQPWLQEPRCQTCHGQNYAEMPGTLYRNSNNGHGGLYCPTCHTSPHAIPPSREERDNRQNIALQGHSGTLRECTVCHGVMPSGPGPHGYYPTGLTDAGHPGGLPAQVAATPNPMHQSAEIRYRVLDDRPILLAIHDVTGREVKRLTSRAQTPGDHTLVWNGADEASRPVPAGVYFARLQTGGSTVSTRLVKIGK